MRRRLPTRERQPLFDSEARKGDVILVRLAWMRMRRLSRDEAKFWNLPNAETMYGEPQKEMLDGRMSSAMS